MPRNVREEEQRQALEHMERIDDHECEWHEAIEDRVLIEVCTVCGAIREVEQPIEDLSDCMDEPHDHAYNALDMMDRYGDRGQ
jgi:hypothetical protein